MAAIEMAADQDGESRAAPAAALFADLQDDAVEGDGVVAADDAGLLVAKDGLELGEGDRDKGGGRVGGAAAKRRVVGGQEVFEKVAVRGRKGADPGEAELVDQAILQGAIDPFTP